MRPSDFLLSAAAGVGAAMIASSASAAVAIGVSVGIAPPPIPIYAQPPIPGPGYLWTPGYWGWDGYDYYWVPGTWVLPPGPGLYWTPAYWAWDDGVYVWNTGYWGPFVGFYGGIDYGFGYDGIGYDGGYWRGPAFYYNRVVNNFGGTRITTVYDRAVRPATLSRASFNGGPGGVQIRPTAQQLAAARTHTLPPTQLQIRHEQAARADRALQASINHGRPPVAATAHPGRLAGAGVIAASRAGGAFRPARGSSTALASAHVHHGPAHYQQQARLSERRTTHSGSASLARYSYHSRVQGYRSHVSGGPRYASRPPHVSYRSAEIGGFGRGFGVGPAFGGMPHGGPGPGGGGGGPRGGGGEHGRRPG